MSEATFLLTGARPVTETWSVVVLYEDKETRDRAMGICDCLVKRFWSDVEFDFRWWRTDFLNDFGMAETAAAEAAEADVFIFSSSARNGLSPVFVKWLANCSERRKDRPGMFLDLTDNRTQDNPVAWQKQSRLREIAARAGLDYFNRVPIQLSGEHPTTWPDAETRASQVTSVLDETTRYLRPPTHFGLNE